MATDDAELARRAVAGDGDAFAELYDRHERRVYGFCMRLLGAPHDAADATQDAFVRMLARLPAMAGRELNFVAYALACARNACYDMIEGRKRVEPTAEQSDGTPSAAAAAGGASPHGEIALDPERAALLAAAREDVRAANAALPARQREVLALREVELLSYDEIGEIMGLSRNAVAQLVSRARIKLRDLLRSSALASVVASSPECTRAQPLLASLQDGQPGEDEELAWARTHLQACETCRVSRAAMEEAGVSYRALAPLVPAAWLRHATIAQAADFVGADWSHLTATPPRGTRLSRWWGRRPVWMLAGAAVLALCIVVVAMAGGTRDGPARYLSSPSALRSVPAKRPVAAGTHKHRSLSLAGVQGPLASSTSDRAHVDTASPRIVSRRSTRHVDARHRQRTPGRRSPTVSSTPTATTPPPTPAPSPAITTTTTATPPPLPTTAAPPAQTTPEPAPPATTPGGSTGTTTTPESPRGGLIP
jgi:RNA polymerase sigma factor (sigma-70 family)